MSSLSEKRYFIAILPPIDLMNEVESIKLDFANNFKSKGAKNAPAHITLHMPFLWREEKEQQLILALNKLKKNNKSFEVHLNHFSHFDERVIFIDIKINDVLTSLQKQVVNCMKHFYIFNQLEDKREFHPHMTVAFRDLKKEQFAKAWQEYKEKKFDKSFICSSFSLLRHENKLWEEIHRFKLNDFLN
jgi:2'-5' RNA ligase